MRGHSAERRVPFVVMALLLVAGCTSTKFVYKPGAPTAGGMKLPVKVAVLPFKDGTEDFTDRGSIFGSGHFNLAKTGIPLNMDAFPPEMWAKSFAEDLAASGGFQSVRFLYSPSELVDEDFFVEGTLNKAYVGKTWEDTNTFAVSLRALTGTDKRLVWEKEVAKEWKLPKNIFAGCGMGIQCTVDKFQGEYNKAMQEIFAAARADLVTTLASISGNRSGGKDPRAAPSAAGEAAGPGTSKPESVEQTIERLLREK